MTRDRRPRQAGRSRTIGRRIAVGLLVAAALVLPGVDVLPAHARGPAARDIPNMGGANSVVCRPDGTCLAVGGGFVVFNAAGVVGPLKTVNGAGRFAGVACVRSGACYAVGEATWDHPVVVELAADGTPGAVRPIPGMTRPYGIACPSSTTCIAVGDRRDPLPSYPYMALTAVFSVITDGQPARAQRFPRDVWNIVGIACPTQTRCLAVGDGTLAVMTKGLDTTWTARATSGSSSGGAGRVVGDISCPSSSACYAAAAAFPPSGVGVPGIMAVSPDGVAGPVQALSDRTGHLWGISCLGDGACTLVGGDNASGQGVVIQVRPGSPPVASIWENSNYFSDVSCLPPIGCGIVGNKPLQAVFAWTS